jgi:hypothetical protein
VPFTTTLRHSGTSPHVIDLERDPGMVRELRDLGAGARAADQPPVPVHVVNRLDIDAIAKRESPGDRTGAP